MGRAACCIASLMLACGGSTDSDPATGGGASGGRGGTGGGVIGGSGGSGGAVSGGTGGIGGGVSGGTGGAPSGGGSGAMSPGAECQVAEDCRMVEDCCSCASIARGEPVDSCFADCDEYRCTHSGIGPNDVACVAGRCTFVQSCNQAAVTCDRAPPSCVPGSAPVVHESCYTGACLPVTECSEVSECYECGGLRCVVMATLHRTYHCVETPEVCAASPTCECMGVCQAPLLCGDPASDEIACACLVC